MGDFNWKIWTEKLAKGLAVVLGSTACIYAAEYITANPMPEEYAFWGGLLAIVLLQIGNFIKHTFLVD